MGTPLSDVYDRFFSKADQDFTGKESLVYNILISAISRSRKVVDSNLDFTLSEIEPGEEETYEGYFHNILSDDEVEFIVLRMLYENNRRREQYLINLRELIGTRDFNKLPDKSKELKVLQESMKSLQEEINSFKNEFNTYIYK